MSKKAVVIHSGGMDSSICLALAIQEFGKDQVVSLSFDYKQRHSVELQQAEKICRDWAVDHHVISMEFLASITNNALTNHTLPVDLNTLVVGRNGLMAHIGTIYANYRGADILYMGIIEVETYYRDCSRAYMDLKQQILRIDLDKPHFEIRTPLVKMTKKETLEVADSLGVLDYLLKETVTCYSGVMGQGCGKCYACVLRLEGIRQFQHRFAAKNAK